MTTRNPLLEDPELQRYARQRQAVEERLAEAAKPRDPDPLDSHFRETAPGAWSAKELRRRGVDAVRAASSSLIHGHPIKAGDVLLVLPDAPPKGFATKTQLDQLQNWEIQRNPNGEIIAQESIIVAGHRYAQGDTLMEWPSDNSVPVGFIRPAAALELLKSEAVTPVELIEA